MENASGERKEVAGCDRRRGRRIKRDPGENSQRWGRVASITPRIFAETGCRAGGAGSDVEGRKIKVRRRVARALRRRCANFSGFALRSDHCPTGRKDSGKGSEPDWRFLVGALRDVAETVCDSEGKTRYRLSTRDQGMPSPDTGARCASAYRKFQRRVCDQ